MKKALFVLALTAISTLAVAHPHRRLHATEFHLKVINEYDGMYVDVLVTRGQQRFDWTVRKNATDRFHEIGTTPGPALIEVTCGVRAGRHGLELDADKPKVTVDVDPNCRLEVEYH